jgi:hypothetical protein
VTILVLPWWADKINGKEKSFALPLGYVDTFDIIIAIFASEIALKKFGAQVKPGKFVASTQQILLKAYLEESSVIFSHNYLELANESSCI